MRNANVTGSMLLIAALAALLTACVSTQTGGFDRDRQQALQLSVQLARQYIANGDWKSAQRHLRTALDIDPDYSDAHGALAMVFQETGELERAEQHFRQALRLDPRNAQTRNNYAVFLYKDGQLDRAEQELEKVVDNLDYDRRADAFLNLGVVRQEQGDWAGAREPLERALLMERNNAYAAIKLGLSYYQLGEYQLAQEVYDRYRAQSRSQSAEALLLGIRLADRFRDSNAFASYALALKNLYPKSQQYLIFQDEYRDAGNR